MDTKRSENNWLTDWPRRGLRELKLVYCTGMKSNTKSVGERKDFGRCSFVAWQWWRQKHPFMGIDLTWRWRFPSWVQFNTDNREFSTLSLKLRWIIGILWVICHEIVWILMRHLRFRFRRTPFYHANKRRVYGTLKAPLVNFSLYPYYARPLHRFCALFSNKEVHLQLLLGNEQKGDVTERN